MDVFSIMAAASDKVESHLHLESYENRIVLRQIGFDTNIRGQEAFPLIRHRGHQKYPAHL